MLKKDKILMSIVAVIIAVTGFAFHAHVNSVILFLLSATALIIVAMIVGKATDQLGNRMGPASTGFLQSALGNLPELFVCIFALRAGLDTVVKSALIGSILGNSVLVFGAALFLGGLKNGKQTFHSGPPRIIAALMLLAFAAMALPSLTYYLHTPAETHINKLDIMVAIVLIIVFVASSVYSFKSDKNENHTNSAHAQKSWSLTTTLIVLCLSGVAAAFVSDWFVEALQPAMNTLGINEVFAGLVVVAIAGNAIENVVGIQLAVKNKPDYAVSVILNSSLQIALLLYPVLLILSFFLGGAILSFVLSPLLLVSYALAVIISTFIVFDGESVWMEGIALIGLYIIIATAFWWG